ncbi:uncharacterized protein [Vulpes vulpes]|uniref:Uncharacterized protein isoform X2 n=1 Tax=Vulpes vulpes TaxID=9627 RepID=A0ABM4ZJ43_VULVU
MQLVAAAPSGLRLTARSPGCWRRGDTLLEEGGCAGGGGGMRWWSCGGTGGRGGSTCALPAQGPCALCVPFSALCPPAHPPASPTLSPVVAVARRRGPGREDWKCRAPHRAVLLGSPDVLRPPAPCVHGAWVPCQARAPEAPDTPRRAHPAAGAGPRGSSANPRHQQLRPPRTTIWTHRVRFLEERVLPHWAAFTIWNAGRQGRRLYRSLSAGARRKVVAFCDVDENKIRKGFYCYEDSKETPKPRVPILHFRAARPPFVICVKLDLTGGEFEANLRSLNLQEGRDFLHFS